MQWSSWPWWGAGALRGQRSCSRGGEPEGRGSSYRGIHLCDDVTPLLAGRRSRIYWTLNEVGLGFSVIDVFCQGYKGRQTSVAFQACTQINLKHQEIKLNAQDWAPCWLARGDTPAPAPPALIVTLLVQEVTCDLWVMVYQVTSPSYRVTLPASFISVFLVPISSHMVLFMFNSLCLDS